MKSRKIVLGLGFLGLGFSFSSKVSAQDVDINLSGDLVSSYVWRGFKNAGASVQPSLSASVACFTLGAWASTDISSAGSKEVDFYASYVISGLQFTVTDYWWDGEGTHRYFSYPHAEDAMGHLLELGLGYTLPEAFPLSLSWNTFVLGKGNKKGGDGDNSFSTYIEASYPFSVKNVDMKIAAGFTPWESSVYGTDGFKFTNILLGASKEVKITDSFSVPVFANIIANPAVEDIHFVFGITLK